jgi:hypothetical protein
LLGPRRNLGAAIETGNPRLIESARQQAAGARAAPWWIATARKLWVALFGGLLAIADQTFGWNLTGSALEAKADEFLWLAIESWLIYRAANRATASTPVTT